jgi:outer membrane autotransporter protein
VVDTVQHNKVDTQLDGGGVIGGYDVIRSMDDGPGIWMAGIMGGYLRSSLNFDNSVTDAKFESGAVGGYLTYLRGGWFLDGQVLANLGTVRYSGTFSQKDHANVTSIGGVLDTGYRMAYGMGFIEPGATLSYVNSDIDDLGIYGTTVNFTSGDSLRGRVGLRLGTTVVKEQAKYEPFIGVSALYEFLGDNTADVTSGDYVVKATDNLTGALGEVTGGVNVFSLAGDGFSAFAKGGFEFGKDDLIEYGGTLGVRVDW